MPANPLHFQELVNDMKYDYENAIDRSDPKNPRYRIKMDFNRTEFSGFETADVRGVVEDLEYTLCYLINSDLTFDAETLLPTAWCTNAGSKHNRTLGLILRLIVDLELAPLKRLPKGNGTRIRFSIND